jgi:hypothetical protein
MPVCTCASVAKLLKTLLDPYHTYLSLAAVAMYASGSEAGDSWRLQRLDPLLNAREETSRWARERVRNDDGQN